MEVSVEKQAEKQLAPGISSLLLEESEGFARAKIKIFGHGLREKLDRAWDDFGKRLLEESKRAGSKSPVRGFVNKIPLPIRQAEFRRRYGANASMEEVVVDRELRASLDTAVQDLLGKEGLEYCDWEKVKWDFTEGQDPHIYYELIIEKTPHLKEIDLGSLPVEKYVAEVSEKEARQHLETEAASTLAAVPCSPRPAKEGDILEVDLKITGPGGSLEEKKGFRLHLGSQALAQELQKKLIGRSAGDSLSHDLPIPEGVEDPRYSGKRMMVVMKVGAVMDARSHSLDKNFALSLGYATVEEAIEGKKEELEAQAKELSFLLSSRKLIEALSKFDVRLPERRFEVEWKQARDKLFGKEWDLPDDQFQSKFKRSKAETEAKLRDIVRIKVTSDLFLKKFRQDQEIELGSLDFQEAETRHLNFLQAQRRDAAGLIDHDWGAVKDMLRKDKNFCARVAQDAMERKTLRKFLAACEKAKSPKVVTLPYSEMVKRYQSTVNEFADFMREGGAKQSKPQDSALEEKAVEKAVEKDSKPDSKSQKSPSKPASPKPKTKSTPKPKS